MTDIAYSFSVPSPTGTNDFSLVPGASMYFVGANGSGKTRLAVKIEELLRDRSHRIAAHRALSLNPEVSKISERAAMNGLQYGYVGEKSTFDHRMGNRWNGNAAISLLNDYDFLIQALFAEQSNTSLVTHKKARAGSTALPSPTKFEKLIEVWERILPHRKLEISGDSITTIADSEAGGYSAKEMSDGERAVFYLLGHALTAQSASLLIFDEPELHIHRSILSRLWDEIEALRPDCGIVVISHDLDFVASRRGDKFVLKNYTPRTGWAIEAVPTDSSFDEDTATLILGSRKPVLFAEGADTSLDRAIFRACYPEFTVISRGSCEEVIHAVVTMRANPALTRITCAGIVDADSYDSEAVAQLESRGIAVLPVSEIENLFLLPDVIASIAESDGYSGDELANGIAHALEELFEHASREENRSDCVLRYCRRRIDRILKKIDLSEAANPSDLSALFSAKTNSLDIMGISRAALKTIEVAIENKDAELLLRWYDNKGLLVIPAKLKSTTVGKFEQWVVRSLRNGTAPLLSKALQRHLPTVDPR